MELVLFFLATDGWGEWGYWGDWGRGLRPLMGAQSEIAYGEYEQNELVGLGRGR